MSFDEVIGYLKYFNDLSRDALTDGMGKIADAALAHSYDELLAEALSEIDESRTMYGCKTKLTLGYGYYLPLTIYRLADNCSCGVIVPRASRRQFVYKYDSKGRIRLILAQDKSTAVICSHDGNSAVYYLFDTVDGIGKLRDVAALEYDENGCISQMVLVYVGFFIQQERRQILMFYEKYRDIGTCMREVTAYELISNWPEPAYLGSTALTEEFYIFRDRVELQYEDGEIVDYIDTGKCREKVNSIELLM